jgi:hypothetical protein
MENGGGKIWITEDEGERIRMGASSMAGREIHSTTKRARRAAAPDDDDDDDGKFFPSSCPSECSDSLLRAILCRVIPLVEAENRGCAAY